MSLRIFSRLSVLVGLLALAPLFAEEAAKPVTTLSDEDVRGLLERAEIAQWERTVSVRAGLVRDLERAKVKATGSGLTGTELYGFESDTPEQRKAKAEKLVQDLAAKIADVDKTLGTMREIAASRVKAASFSVACPILQLKEAFAISSGELRAAAGADGYKTLSLAGVFVPLNGTMAADSGLTDALRAALTSEANGPVVEAAPTFSAGALNVASDKKTGVVVAEVHPLKTIGGALWSVRLVDAATFRVVAASSAFIPSPAALEAAKKDYSNRDKQPTSYEISVQDRRNFVARLGAGINLSFGVEGTGAEATMLRAALVTRKNPALNDFAFLASVLGGPKTDSVSKALWVIQPGADVGNFALGARQVGGRSSAVAPVGEVSLLPVVTKSEY
jgi:hypothetical protein